MTYSDAGVGNEVRDSYGVRKKTEPYTIIMTISTKYDGSRIWKQRLHKAYSFILKARSFRNINMLQMKKVWH
jgi:hypothetical protein